MYLWIKTITSTWISILGFLSGVHQIILRWQVTTLSGLAVSSASHASCHTTAASAANKGGCHTATDWRWTPYGYGSKSFDSKKRLGLRLKTNTLWWMCSPFCHVDLLDEYGKMELPTLEAYPPFSGEITCLQGVLFWWGNYTLDIRGTPFHPKVSAPLPDPPPAPLNVHLGCRQKWWDTLSVMTTLPRKMGWLPVNLVISPMMFWFICLEIHPQSPPPALRLMQDSSGSKEPKMTWTEGWEILSSQTHKARLLQSNDTDHMPRQPYLFLVQQTVLKILESRASFEFLYIIRNVSFGGKHVGSLRATIQCPGTHK